jgi:hypothetical protein
MQSTLMTVTMPSGKEVEVPQPVQDLLWQRSKALLEDQAAYQYNLRLLIQAAYLQGIVDAAQCKIAVDGIEG